uniref:VWFD domain-containing protein n=1 Tax=Dendroctonus ponderosae TaxID=77166 RepID=A0AAR5PVR9_DENPD
MKTYLACFLVTLLGLSETRFAENAALDECLANQSINVQPRLRKHMPTQGEDTVARAVIENPRRSASEMPNPSINIFTQFNKTFFVIGNSIFLGTMHKELSMEPYGDFEHGNRKIFKSFEYEKTGFLAISHKSDIKFYLLYENSTTPELIQKLWSPYISDGRFFTNADNLYFVLSSNISHHIGHLTFYKWMGSYFDHIEEVQATGIIKIDSFPWRSSEIFIAERKLPGLKLRSSVYEFKYDKATKIQELDTNNPFQMNIFIQKHVPYVLIYEESHRQRLFKWTGFEMVAVKKFEWKHEVNNSMVVYSNSIPLIVHPQLEKVMFFKAENEDIVLHQTKRYVVNFSIISDINKGQNEKGNITFIAGLSEDYTINIYGMYVEAHAEMEREQGEPLRNCFNNLAEKVYDPRSKLNQANVHSSPRKRQTNIDSTINGTDITIQFNNLDKRLKRVKELINNPENFPNEFVVNSKAVIKGSIKAKNIIGNHLRFDKINGKPWTPELWLQSDGKQIITGAVWIRNLKSKILVANGTTANIFKDLLRSNSTQKITGKFKIKKLVASEISAKTINNIEVNQIYKKNDSVIIKGVKSFNNVSSKNATVSKINGKDAQDVLRKLNQPNNLVFASNITIEKLEVETIDNITWNHLKETLFKIGKDHTIFGNISGPKFTTTHLKAGRINGVDPKNFMTTSTDQIINSTIQFNNIQAFKLDSKLINGQNPANFAQIDQNVTVKGPVKIQNIAVENNLIIRDKDNSFTNKTELHQRYHGKITVHGNLYVNNFSILPNTTVTLNGNTFPMEALNQYWTKDGNQTIPTQLEAQKGITVPHLQTKYLNNVPMERFAVNSNKTQIKGPLVFKNATVYGNVVLHKTAITQSFNLSKLAFEAVKNDGKPYHIKGKKTFRNTLVANRLSSPANVTLYTNQLSGINKFKRVTVEGDVVGNVHTELINNINITKLMENVLPLDRSQNLSHMAFKRVAVENLRVERINGINVTKYMTILEGLLKSKHFKQINIKGNVTLQQIQDLKTINAHDIRQLLEKQQSEINQEVTFLGDVKFSGKANITNLKTRIINGIDFLNLTRRHFHKISNQTVSGKYTFTTLKTNQLYTKRINDMNVENLIDISSKKPQRLSAPLGIILKNATFKKSIKSNDMWPCDIHKAMDNIRYPQTQEWNSVEIIGNVSFLDKTCDLMRIIEKSVKKTKRNIILAPVHITEHVLADHVRIENLLSNINLTDLINDVVLADSDEEQIITGHKTFSNHISADYVTITENADIPFVNRVYIPELYRRIIRKDEINNVTILGRKTFFAGLQADRVFVDNVGQLKPENIVTLANLREIPNAIFDAIEITNDLNVEFINNYNISDVLANRVLINTTKKQIVHSVCYFDDLEVSGDLTTPVINNVNLKDVVFDIGEQKINSLKKFQQDIMIFGNLATENINGINITEAYKNAVLPGSSDIIVGSITRQKSEKFIGNIDAVPENTKEIMNNPANNTEKLKILAMSPEIKSIIEESLPKVKHMPKELMYIEKSEDLQIGIQNAIDARVTKIKDYTLIYIISEESHDQCSLPEGCKCLIQHTLEVSPHLSVALISSEARQRTYSYDTDTLTIHVQTSSISTDQRCRANSTDEISTLHWSTRSSNISDTTNTYPVMFTGYLRAVEFFTLGGTTYAVLALYYDPITDTHDLNCTIIRFKDDKTSASEIQQIETHRASTLHILHTAQGVIMIIGNVADQSYTKIYKFNDDLQKFELLRSLSFGCTKAVGVVLRTDSLIILANEDASLQVLRYHPNFNNYYFYQALQVAEPVLGISVFYIGDFGISDAYLCIVTEDNYRIYSFQYIDGWKLESRGLIRGLRNLIPVEIEHQLYLFAASTKQSSLLKVAQFGALR